MLTPIPNVLMTLKLESGLLNSCKIASIILLAVVMATTSVQQLAKPGDWRPLNLQGIWHTYLCAWTQFHSNL